MTFFNDDEISRMRTELNAQVLPGTAYILRMVAGSGLYGSFTGTAGTAGTVACRIDRLNRSSGDGIIADAEIGTTFYQGTFPWNADLRDGDDVKSDGVVFRVLQVSRAQDAQLVTRAVMSTVDEGN